LDWKWVQDTYKDRWVDAARRVFGRLDGDADGALDPGDIAAAFAGGLDEYEVDAAVHEALLEAVGTGGEGEGEADSAGSQRIDFAHFLELLQSPGALDDLALYDGRLSGHSSRAVSRDMGAPPGALRRLLCCAGG
jgi:hypothetical protein